MNRSARLLYIEDDDLDRRAFLRLVRGKGLPWEVTLAETLAAARAHLATPRFDIIVADYHLPDGDSTELFGEVPDMPFVLLTATLEEELALRTLERGADDYLAKDPERRYLEALPFTVEKTLYRERIRERERRLARQLRESEERFHLLVEGVKEYAIFMLDPRGRIVTWNSGAQRIKGYTAEEILGQPFSRLYTPEEAAAGKPQDELAIATQAGQYGDEDWRLRKDGSRFWASVTITALRDPAGELRGFTKVVQDLTERKRAEEALRESETHYRMLFDTIDEGFCVIEVIFDEHDKPIDYRFLETNPSFEKQTGLADAKGKTMRELAPEHEEHWFETYGRIALTGQPARFQNYARQLHRWYDVYAFRIGQPEDRQVAVLFNDISEHKRAEEAIHAAEAQLRSVTDTMAAGVSRCSRDLRYLWVSQAYTEWLGRPAEQIVGRSMAEILGPAGYEVVRSYVEQVLTGQRVEYEAQVDAPGLGPQWIHAIYTPTYDKAGAVDGWVGVVTDITHSKSLEESLRDSRQQLQEINQTLEQRVAERTAEAEARADQIRELAAELTRTEQRERRRLAQILHDHLQQLLVGAKFGTSILRGRLAGDDDTLGHLQRVEDLLDQSILASRSLTVELYPPILSEGGLAPALRWLAGWMLEKHGLEVKVEADETVNPADEEIRTLLFQSVRELLFNVVKHAKVNTATVTTDRCCRDQMRIVVADRGVGFDPDTTQHRIDARTGLGLLSMQERLEAMGSRLQIESAPGKGARMTLVAPVHLHQPKTAAPTAGEPAATQAPAAEPRTPGRCIRVLIADDHAVIRDGMSGLLQMHGDIEVVGTAADGQLAVELSSQLQPDVVLMDVSMPRLNGIEAARYLRRQMPHICIIGLSMHGEEETALRMREAGAAHYLTKTVPPEQVIAAIRTCSRSA